MKINVCKGCLEDRKINECVLIVPGDCDLPTVCPFDREEGSVDWKLMEAKP